ncbi:MAG: alpha/beta fold hydrolase [Lachnospiraceae bacterium]
MKKREFYYLSCDGATQIYSVEWAPEGEIRAVLQISHGMVEHINRYEEFASYLTEKGFLVVGNDHLGHGRSVQQDEDHGFFHETSGNKYVVGDIHNLRLQTQKNHPDIPYFMLGHSMGSFLLRQYLTSYSEGLCGAVIMGTGYHSMPELVLGQTLCKIIASVKGWRYRSTLVNAISFGSFNRHFKPCESDKDWVTSDTAKRDEYLKDPFCNFVFTVNGYYHMFEGMKVLAKKENICKIKNELPVFFVSGEDDPVGGFGKGVRKVYKKYVDAGMKNVEMKLYKNDRHEILNETDRAQVYEDIALWMLEIL